ESQARALPDFGPRGQMHFFAGSLLETLRGNYSGIDASNSLAIVLLAPIVLLVLRPPNIRLLRPEVLWMAVTTVILFALAHAILFRLYLPNRYTYPLLPFSCIATAVGLRPTLESLGNRLRPGWLVVTLAAMLAAVVLLGELSVAGGGQSPYRHCVLDAQALRYIGTLPKSAIIAGDPTSVDCVPIVSERPVVISRKLNQGLSPSYL